MEQENLRSDFYQLMNISYANRSLGRSLAPTSLVSIGFHCNSSLEPFYQNIHFSRFTHSHVIINRMNGICNPPEQPPTFYKIFLEQTNDFRIPFQKWTRTNNANHEAYILKYYLWLFRIMQNCRFESTRFYWETCAKPK